MQKEKTLWKIFFGCGPVSLLSFFSVWIWWIWWILVDGTMLQRPTATSLTEYFEKIPVTNRHVRWYATDLGLPACYQREKAHWKSCANGARRTIWQMLSSLRNRVPCPTRQVFLILLRHSALVRSMRDDFLALPSSHFAVTCCKGTKAHWDELVKHFCPAENHVRTNPALRKSFEDLWQWFREPPESLCRSLAKFHSTDFPLDLRIEDEDVSDVEARAATKWLIDQLNMECAWFQFLLNPKLLLREAFLCTQLAVRAKEHFRPGQPSPLQHTAAYLGSLRLDTTEIIANERKVDPCAELGYPPGDDELKTPLEVPCIQCRFFLWSDSSKKRKHEEKEGVPLVPKASVPCRLDPQLFYFLFGHDHRTLLGKVFSH